MDSAKRFCLLVFALLATALAAPAAASAVTCEELQDALDNSNPGDTITLDDEGLCNDHFDLPSHTITLTGAGAQGQNGFDGENEDDFQILHGEDVGDTTISNLRFEDGDAEGDGHGELSDGGAIHITGQSTPTLERNIFVLNDADDSGGAVYINSEPAVSGRGDLSAAVDGEKIVLRDNIFGGFDEGNDAGENSRGGAAHILTFGDLDVIGNRFEDNTAEDGSGGALYSVVFGRTTLEGNEFFDNSAYAKGGGATLRVCGDGRVTGNTFEENHLEDPSFDRSGDVSANVFGGAGGPMGAGLHMAEDSNCTILTAAAPDEDFDVVQSGNDFQGNVIHQGFGGSRGTGAGEGTQDLNVKSTDDTFVGNQIETPNGQGGGYSARNQEGNVLEARNLVATANTIRAEEPEEAPLAVVPTGDGGGIYVGAAGSELRLFNSTITTNEASEGSGISGARCDGLTLHNSIVYGNTGADDEIVGFDCPLSERLGAAAAPGDPRDVQFTDTCFKGTPHPGEGNICADPLLADPASGNVDQTSGSPTLNKGSSGLVPEDLPNDYRADARVQGPAVDMGADEQVVAPTTTTTTAPALGCLNAGGNVRGRTLGPARLGRTRPVQRSLFSGNQLRTRLGLDKYCAVPRGWFRLGYPNARLNRPFGRSLRRSVSNRVVLILTSSPRFSLLGITRNSTRATARRRLRGERSFRIGKNTWYVVRASGRRLFLVKVQSGRVKEIGLGDARVAPNTRLLRAYLRAWEGGL